jgi:hypothetical protein
VRTLPGQAILLARLANGEKDDITGSNLNFILICALILFGAALFMVLPIVVAHRRGNPWGEAIRAGSIFWGIGAAWSVISAATAAWKWAKEQNTLLLSGYYDPTTRGDGPKPPWTWWLVLAGVYLVLLGLAATRGRSPSPPSPSEPAKTVS